MHGNYFRLSLPVIQRYDREMNDADEKRIAAKLAKLLTMLCVRNTKLEDLHAGTAPVSKTVDYSDVMVIDAEGRDRGLAS